MYDRMNESEKVSVGTEKFTVELSYEELFDIFTLLKAENFYKDLREQYNQSDEAIGGNEK